MRLLSVIGLAWCLATASLSAQSGGVTVELALEQKQFLPNEDVIVSVRVRNLSGRTLQLGKTSDWLTFNVQGREGYIVSKLADVPVEGDLDLLSSLSATRRINLTPYFNFQKSGQRYEITASVKLPDWSQPIRSAPEWFDVTMGTKLKELEFGLPRNGDAAGSPEIRKYVLQQSTYLKQNKLYFRLTDASGSHTFKVYPLGQMVSFGNPEAQIDRDSSLHVLHQNGAHTFNYYVINSSGELLVRHTYEFNATRPAIRGDDSGKVFVAGGARRLRATDFPSLAQSEATDASTENGNAKPPQP